MDNIVVEDISLYRQTFFYLNILYVFILYIMYFYIFYFTYVFTILYIYISFWGGIITHILRH